MLKKFFKGLMITIGFLLLIVVLFYTFIYFRVQARMNKVYSVKLQTLKLPHDSASYAAGEHVAINRGCLGCHGHDLSGGRAFLEPSSPVGALYAANITSGKGGINFTDADWIRALRHGLGKDSKSLWFMPSHEVCHLSNQEMAELISFLKQQPAVDKTVPAKSIKPLGRILTFFDQFPLFPAELIDHNAEYKDVVKVAVTAEYGGYLATTCQGCHGKSMKGAPAHGEQEPPIPDISTTGHPGKWSESDFLTALRTGKTPEGKVLSVYMPWKELKYTDEELKSIYLYLQQLK